VKALPPMLRAVSPTELAERVHIERRGVPFIVYLDGDGRQQLVDLGERAQALSVGRGETNDIALPWDTEVSRVHAMLEPVGGEWTLVDDGLSRNGSFVNGERVRSRRRLADGDLLGIGRTLLVFAAVAVPDAVPTEAARDSIPPELSPAQRRVLAALCRPAREQPFAGPPSNREIAEELVVSVDTVKSHLHALFELFGVQDMPQNAKRAELVRRAFERGLAGG
jgi:pSer/pThr/pTyr-binding forkhead associated (FHA) protein